MARKAKEVLLARGYTEAELTSMATLLADPKFCAAIEAEAAEADTHKENVTKLQKDLDDDAAWYRDIVQPKMSKADQDVADAMARAAAAEARIKAAQDAGLIKIAAQEGNPVVDTKPVVNNKPPIDESKFVTADTFNQAYEQVGNAIEMAQDIVGDHQELFGKRLPGGIGSLRKSWREAVTNSHFKGSLRDYWETAYKVSDRRTALIAEDAKKHDDQIRTEERTKVLSEMGNPMTRALSTSRNPFTNRAEGATGTDGKPAPATKPWEKTDSDRASSRVSKFTAKALQSVQ